MAGDRGGARFLTGATDAQGANPPTNRVPLRAWTCAGTPGAPGDAWVETTAAREHTYALRVESDSMTPRFRPGDILIVEPDMDWQSGSFVVAKNGSDDVVFRKIVREMGTLYLVPLNDRYPVLPLGDYQVIGVVRQAIDILA